MRKWMVLSLLAVWFPAVVLVACNGETGEEVPAVTVTGEVIGYHANLETPNLRVCVMGSTTHDDQVELASCAVDWNKHTFSIALSGEPPQELKWTELGDNITERTELLIFSYLDENENGGYDPVADGTTLGFSKDIRLYYLTHDYEAQEGKRGYNWLDSTTNKYRQDFDSLPTIQVPTGSGGDTGGLGGDGSSAPAGDEDGEAPVGGDTAAPAAGDEDEPAGPDADPESGEE